MVSIIGSVSTRERRPTMMKITKSQAEKLAEFVASVRPDWDVRGIVAQLAKAVERGDVWHLAMAAIRAAANPANKTPAVIGLSGGHWKSDVLDGEVHPSRVPVVEQCRHCCKPREHCQSTFVQANDPHAFLTEAELQRRALDRVERERREASRPPIREREFDDAISEGVPRSAAVAAELTAAIDAGKAATRQREVGADA